MANKSVVLSLLGNNSGALKAIEDTDVKLDGLKEKSGDILIGASTGDAQAEVDRLDKALEDYKAAAEEAAGASDRLKEAENSEGTSASELAAKQAEAAKAARDLKKAQVELGEAEIETGDKAKAAAAKQDELATQQKYAGDSAVEAGDKEVALGDKARASGDSAEESGHKFKMAGLLIVGGLVAAGYESTKLAITFNSTMETLHTQAGVAQSKIKGLGNGILQLAGQVGQNPDSLAEALYHVESSFASMGISGTKALGLVKIAAEGATTGHADLVDVTNALDAAVASGIKGTGDMGQAMGTLNAIVGSGDMKMQDLADAFGSGMVATVKGFGLSLKDVGAALAVFGDNNIRGAHAGTQLRMSVMALASPSVAGIAQLKTWGTASDGLATTMRQHGLLAALEQLHGLFVKNGVTAADQGEYITNMFGKKAGAGVNVLMDQLDRLKSKYPAITAGANKFGSDWKAAAETPAVKLAQLKDGFEAMGITLGTILLPPLTWVLGKLVSFFTWIDKSRGRVIALIGVLGVLGGTILAGKLAGAIKGSINDIGALGGMFEKAAIKMGLLTGAQEAQTGATEAGTVAQGELDTAMDANPIGLIIIAVAALVIGFIELWKHCKAFRDFWIDAWKDIRIVFSDSITWIKDHWVLAFLVVPLVVVVIEIIKHWHEIRDAFGDMVDWIKSHWIIVGLLVAPVLLAVIEIARHWDEIKSNFGSMVHWIASTWDAIPGILYRPVLAAARAIEGGWQYIVNGAAAMGNGLLTFFYNLPGRIVGAVGNLGSLLYDAGWNIMVGFWNGLVGMWNKIANFISGIAGWISSHKGPIEFDAVLLYPHGRAVMGGLVHGLQDGMPGLNQQLSRVTSTIAGTHVGSGTSRGSNGNTLQVEWVGGAGADQKFISWLKENIRFRGGDPGVLGR